MIRSRIWKKKKKIVHGVIKCSQVAFSIYMLSRPLTWWFQNTELHVPRGAVDSNLPADAGDMDSIPIPEGSQMPQSRYVPVLQLLKHALLEPILGTKRSQHSEKLSFSILLNEE